MDAASESGVEQVREVIVDVAEYQPTQARYKVFIIDEVHDLSGKAFDALLKTIEEPPAHVVFILATTEYNKVPPTIRSRCQKFEFHRGTIADLVTRLEYVAAQEKVTAEPAALAAIARMADGGYRDALTLLEQAMVTADGPITLAHVYEQLGLIPEELVDGMLIAIKDCDASQIMKLMEEAWRMGRDPRSVLESMEYRLGDLTRAVFGVDLGTTDATREASLHETAAKIGKDALLAMRSEIAEAHRSIRDVSLPRLWLEAELIRIGRLMNDGPKVVQPYIEQRPASQPTKPTPKADPKPAARPESKTNGQSAAERKVVAQAQPSEEPQFPPTNDPAVAKARQMWAAMLADLPQAPIALKLHGSQVVSVDGSKWVVQMLREFDRDWMIEKPARQGHITSLLKKVTNEELMVSYVVGEAKQARIEPEAVELPMEGARLEQAAKNVLGAQ